MLSKLNAVLPPLSFFHPAKVQVPPVISTFGGMYEYDVVPKAVFTLLSLYTTKPLGVFLVLSNSSVLVGLLFKNFTRKAGRRVSLYIAVASPAIGVLLSFKKKFVMVAVIGKVGIMLFS